MASVNTIPSPDRLVDELGPALAEAVRAQVTAEYCEVTGLCPMCGGPDHHGG